MPFPEFKLESHADVTTVALGSSLAVPAELGPILTKDTTQKAAEFLMSLLDVVAADTIDAETTYNGVNPTKTPSAKGSLKVSSWGSGGGLGMFGGKLHRFKSAALTTFFEKVFNAVQAGIPGSRYSRNNLFHGHSVFDKVDGSVDFRIVFHAYEYPKNLEMTKSALALEVEPGVAAFDDGGAGFYKRNAIWSMRSNSIYIPNYYDYMILMTKEIDEMPYGAVVGSPGCVMNQAKVGEEIVSFNVFPSEGVKLFLKQ